MTAIAKKPQTIKDLIKLTDKENPKPEHLAALRKHLDEDPRLVTANNVSAHALGRVIDYYTSKNGLLTELVKRQVKESRSEMEYDSANAFVRMLIDQVIINNIRLNHLEAIHVAKLEGAHSSEQGIYWDKRLTSAQRRFQRACESLAKVRKLLSEAELKDQQARAKKSQSTLASQRLYKMLSD